jgi:hypothetical protein
VEKATARKEVSQMAEVINENAWQQEDKWIWLL